MLHIGDEKCKFSCSITFGSISNVEKPFKDAKMIDNSLYSITFKKAKGGLLTTDLLEKNQNGGTKQVLVIDGSLTWDETISFTTSLYKNKKKGLDVKKYAFALEAFDPKSNKKKEISTMELNLTDFVAEDGQEKQTTPTLDFKLGKAKLTCPCSVTTSIILPEDEKNPSEPIQRKNSALGGLLKRGSIKIGGSPQKNSEKSLEKLPPVPIKEHHDLPPLPVKKDESNKDIENLKAKIENLENSLLTLREENAKLVFQNQTSTMMVDEMKMQAEQNKIQTTENDLNKQDLEIVDKMVHLEKQIVDLNIEIQNKTEEIEKLNTQVKQEPEGIQTDSTLVVELEQKITILENEKVTLVKSVDELNQNLKQQLVDIEKEKENLSSQILTLSSQIDLQNLNVEKLSNAQKKLEEEKEHMQKDLNIKEVVIQDLQNNLEISVKGLTGQLESFKHQVETLTPAKTKAEQDVLDLQSTLIHHNKELTEKSQFIETLRQENKELETLKDQLHVTMTLVATFEKEAKEAEHDLETKQKHIQMLEETINKAKSSQESSSSLLEENLELKKQVDKSKQDLEEFYIKLEETQKNLASSFANEKQILLAEIASSKLNLEKTIADLLEEKKTDIEEIKKSREEIMQREISHKEYLDEIVLEKNRVMDEMKKLKEASTVLMTTNQGLQVELEALKMQIVTSSSSTGESQEKIEELKSLVDKLEKENDLAQKEMQSLIGERNSLQTQVKLIGEDFEKLQSALKNGTEQKESLMKQIKCLEDSNSQIQVALSLENETNQNSISILENKLKEAEFSLVQLQTDKKFVEQELKDLKTHQEESKQLASMSESEAIKSLQDENEKLSASLRQSNKDLESSMNMVSKLENEVEELRNNLDQTEKELKHEILNLNLGKQSIQVELTRQISMVESNNQELKSEVEKLSKSLKEVNQVLEYTKMENDVKSEEFTSKIQKLEATGSKQEKLIKELENEHNHQGSNITHLNADLEIAHQQVESLALASDTDKVKISSLESQIEQLSQPNKQLDDQLLDLTMHTLVDRSVLLNSCEYVDNVPIQPQIILKSLHFWKFNVSFCSYLLDCLEYVISQSDRKSLLYWVQSLSMILSDLKIKLKGLGRTIPNVKKPIYSKGSHESMDVQEFGEKIFSRLCHAYSRVIDATLDRFSHVSTCDDYLATLEEFHIFVAKYQLPPVVRNHMFEILYLHLDQLYLTRFANKISIDRCLEIKMEVAKLENWLRDHQILCGLAIPFIYTRQCADICILNLKKEILNDTGMREVVCPDLTNCDILTVLKNLSELTESEREEMEQLLNKETSRNDLMRPVKIVFDKRTNLKSGTIEDVYLFESSVEFNKNAVVPIEFAMFDHLRE